MNKTFGYDLYQNSLLNKNVQINKTLKLRTLYICFQVVISIGKKS